MNDSFSKALLRGFAYFQKESLLSRIALILVWVLFLDCTPEWESSYKLAASRSLIPEVDLILVPEVYSIMDDDWVAKKKFTTYTIETLKSQVEKYGNNWETFYHSQSRLILDDNQIQIETEGTSHYTNYEYDRKIPIVFYGPGFIEPGLYLDKVYQQNIVPTLALLLESPWPDGARMEPIHRVLVKNKPNKPQLVVTIVIDQGGLELYKSHPHSFPNIKKLMSQGAYFPRAEVGHLDAHTGVGHAAIGTGAFPKSHRIISNEKTYIENLQGKLVVVSKNVYELSKGVVSPEDLKSQTLADVWDQHRNNKPVIISQCYAARASIGMAGHGAMLDGGDKDFVYWVDKKTLDWSTNSNFFNLPNSTRKFNLYDYNLLNNQNPWWNPKEGILKETFQKNFYRAVATPTQARLEGELFREVVREELINTGLGKDGETDLLYLTLKATDAVGHRHGWESEEARLVLEETDRQVGRIWKLLEENWKGEYVLVVTADHGAAPLREFSKGLYLSYTSFFETIQSLLPENVRESESIVSFFTNGMVSLNRKTMEKYGIPESKVIEKILNIQVQGKRFFRKVYQRKDLENH